MTRSLNYLFSGAISIRCDCTSGGGYFRRGLWNTRRASGVAIVIVMMMVLLIISLTTAAFVVTQQNYTNASFLEKKLKAEFAYKAGVATALERLSEDPSWAPTKTNPMLEAISPGSEVGFKLWLEGLVRSDGSGVTPPSGTTLQDGQAVVKIIPTINGEEVPIASGFAGFQSSLLLVRPEVNFDYNVYNPQPQGSMNINVGYSSPLGIGLCLQSYNSAGTALVLPANTVQPPPDNQYGRIATAGAELGFMGPITLYGILYKPQNTKLYGAGTTAGFPSVNLYDENQALIIDPEPDVPRFVRPDPALPLSNPPSVSNGQVVRIPPGNYTAINTSGYTGVTLELERGGQYYFEFFNIVGSGPSDVHEVVLYGSSSDPCVVYSKGLGFDTVSVNMPTASPLFPQPKDLQFYLTDDGNNYVGLWRMKGAFTVAGSAPGLQIETPCEFYGSLYASKLTSTVLGGGGGLHPPSYLHYDQALQSVEPAAKSQWVVASQER